MIVLPFLPSVPFYTFTTTIEEKPYLFRVRWNGRDSAWYFDVETDDGQVIRQGVKVVLGTYLGRASAEEFFTQGVLWAFDTTSQAKDATFDDIGTRVQVRYYSALEVQGILDGQLLP